MPTLSYEYSSSKNNNVINFGATLGTAAPPLETGTLKQGRNPTFQAATIPLSQLNFIQRGHYNKYTTVHFTSGINILTGGVTFSAYEGSGYGNTHTVTGVPLDYEVDSAVNPYNVAARLVVLMIILKHTNYRK
jgi:hypothetical protein